MPTIRQLRGSEMLDARRKPTAAAQVCRCGPDRPEPRPAPCGCGRIARYDRLPPIETAPGTEARFAGRPALKTLR